MKKKQSKIQKLKMKISLRKNKIWVIVLAILIIIGLNFFQKGIKDFFYFFSEPIQKILWKTGQETSDLFGTIFEIKNLKRELDDLKIENQRLLSEIASLKESKRESEALKEALEIGLKDEFNLSLAEITAKDINEDSILINKGEKDGILKGAPVITESKVLLGRVSEVSQSFSKVMLISNPRSSFDAKIQDKETQGIIEGKGNLSLSLRILPQEREIQEGDLVITTSLGGVFPKGLLVGRVEKLERNDIRPVQEAKILPFFELGQLELVFIISNF